MALTPEDVVNKRFQQTKFREGYDQDEVDDFLDEIVIELRRLTTENAELREKLAEANSGQAIVTPAPAAPAAPTAIASVKTPEDAAAAASANDLLTLARRLHEEHVREGAEKRDALIAEGHETATRIVAEAESAARAQLAELDEERNRLKARITELSNFEKEYREKLRGYINGQLAELDQLNTAIPA